MDARLMDDLHAPGRDAPATARIGDRLAMAAGVFIVLTFVQGWVAPVSGYRVETANSDLLRNAFLPAYGVALALVFSRPWTTVAAFLKSPLVLALLVLPFVSAVWSIDPEATLRRAMALAFTTLAAAALASRFSWRGLAELLAGSYAAMALASLALAAVKPDWAIMEEVFPGALRGLWSEKNALGGVMGLGCVCCVAASILAPERKRLWIGAALLCAALVLASTSKTALLALLLALAAMAGVGLARRGAVTAVVALWLVVVAAGAAALAVAMDPDLLFSTIGKDATLTGRTEIWTAALRQGRERPWTGFGYGVLWDHIGPFDPARYIFRDAGFRPGHAHNGWIETWLGLGFTGLVLWSLWFVEIWLRTLASILSHPGAWLAVPALLLFTLRSFTEVSILTYNDGEWLVIVAVMMGLALGRHRRSA